MKLRKYQSDAILKLVTNKGFGLFLDMGLGKTIIVLKSIQNLKRIKNISRVLIIAPRRVVDFVWEQEAIKWGVNLTFMKLTGTPKQRVKNIKNKADIYLITPDLIKWLHDQKEFFQVIVVDEISMFRNTKSKRFRILMKIRKKAEYVWGLTGTPTPNGIDKIWGIIKLLDNGNRLGKYKNEFTHKYLIPEAVLPNHQIVSWKLRYGAFDEIVDRIKDICISMKNPLELPEFQTIILHTELSTKVQKEYKRFVKDQVIFYKNGDLVASNPAVLVNKLQQFANGHTLLDTGQIEVHHKNKFEVLDEVIRETSKPILIWYNYKADEYFIRKFFGAEELNVEKWNRGEQSLALAHPQSAGHGLNLQFGGSVMLWFSPIWNLELYQQAIKRLYRHGQKEKVINYIISVKNTIDERILAALEKKSINQQALLDMLEYEVDN